MTQLKPDSPRSLNARYQDLDADRRRTWPPEALATYVNQRATLRDAHGTTPHVEIGDTLETAELSGRNGERITLDELTASGRAVLVFFRFAGCPACNVALPYYRDTLWPALAEAGIPLVAISPQPFPALAEIAATHALPFPVLSDPGLAFSRRLGITYLFDDASRAAAIAKGGRPQALNGTDDWELPKPAILIIDRSRTVLFAAISPDWMERTESGTVLDALGLPAKSADPEARAHAA
ncbi:peroxiredoxin-like family protein [Acidomonas methanolica]|uniref:peroxiredoxin-like family protein n=1 Tax=Acidomonas methanolica TaxID=437 RepID=UPI00211A06A2